MPWRGFECSNNKKKKMLQSAFQARQKYEDYQRKQREVKISDLENRKRKCLEESTSDLKQQAKQAKVDMVSLAKSVDDFAVKAENERNFSHIAKSNALREKVKEKSDLCSQGA